MAEQRLAKGTQSFDAAGWSGAGIADDAELAVVDSSLVHTDLQRAADTTTGVNYMHFRGGKPTVGDEDNGDLELEFKEAYTTRENLLWQTLGGSLRLRAKTLECQKAVFAALGGEVTVLEGAFDQIYCCGNNVVRIKDQATVETALYCFGSCVVEIDDKVGDDIPLIVCSEGARVVSRREIPVITVKQRARLVYDGASGSATASLLLDGGQFIGLAGNVPTVEWWGGVLDLLQAQEAFNFGTSAFDIKGTHLAVPAASPLVTVGTPEGLFPSVPISK